MIQFSQTLVTQVCQRCGLGEGMTVIPVSVLKPPAAARYPTSRDSCVNVQACVCPYPFMFACTHVHLRVPLCMPVSEHPAHAFLLDGVRALEETLLPGLLSVSGL